MATTLKRKKKKKSSTRAKKVSKKKTSKVNKKKKAIKKGQKPFTLAKCQEVLEKVSKTLVYNMVKKYENGPLSAIFNEAAMTALAEDKMILTINGIKLFEKEGKVKGSVEHIGAVSYFKTSFFNHSQKIYEKHAKTDLRAGVQTVSGEDAQAVAASKKLITPENDFIIKKEIAFILDKLQKQDQTHNEQTERRFKNLGKALKPKDLQFCSQILKRILEGYEAKEIKQELGLTTIQYSHQRKLALELAKESVPYSFNDLVSYFSQDEDLRIYRRDVKKRKRTLSQIDLQVQNHFFVQSSNKGKKWKTTLCVQLVAYDGEEPFKKISPKTFKIKSVNSSEAEAVFIRKKLLEESCDFEVEKVSKKFLKEIKAA